MPSIRGQYDKLAFLDGKVHVLASSLIDRGAAESDLDRLKRIEALGKGFREQDDAALREACEELRRKNPGQISSAARRHLTEVAFALLREASRRTIGLYHYPEQLLAGLALVRGGIAEMATGEGKTLAISLPAFVFSLEGKGVHVVTVNSYLAKRDHEFIKPVFDLLGVSVGLLPEGQGATPEKKTGRLWMRHHLRGRL